MKWELYLILGSFLLFFCLIWFQIIQLGSLNYNKDIIINSNPTPVVAHEDPITFVIPDLHGDYNKTIKILQHASIVDENLDWIAPPNVWVVQTGDSFDRGLRGRDIIKLFMKLKEQAPANRFHHLFGNHDFINLHEKDYRYVDRKEWDLFGGRQAREKELSMEGEIGKFLRTDTKVALVLHDTLFTHAGMNENFFSMGIDTINDLVLELLQGKNEVWERVKDVIGGEGPWWTRNFAITKPDEEKIVCERVDRVLKLAGAKRMMIGHNFGVDTENAEGRVRVACNKKLWGLDVGISYVYGGPTKYVKIQGDNVKIIERTIPDTVQNCLQACERMCCGAERKASHRLPTCAMGCFSAFDRGSLQSCQQSCDEMKEESKCLWKFSEGSFDTCQMCGPCRPEENACETGCKSFFKKS